MNCEVVFVNLVLGFIFILIGMKESEPILYSIGGVIVLLAFKYGFK